MPRPQKATAEYFQHSTKKGKTIFTLEAKYGNDGYALWFKTLELLTATEHHYLNFNDESLWEYYLTVVSIDENKTIEILNLLAKLNAIDADLWKHKIIWCENLIHNLAVLYNKRLVKPLSKTEILVVSGAETPNSRVNDSDNPHSREENRIEEKSIEDDTKTKYKYPDDKLMVNTSFPLLSFFYDLIMSYCNYPLVDGVSGHIVNSGYNQLKMVYELCDNDESVFIMEMNKKINGTWAVGKLKNSSCPMQVINSVCGYIITDLQKKKEETKHNKPDVKVPIRPKFYEETTEQYEEYKRNQYKEYGVKYDSN